MLWAEEIKLNKNVDEILNHDWLNINYELINEDIQKYFHSIIYKINSNKNNVVNKNVNKYAQKFQPIFSSKYKEFIRNFKD